MEFLFKILGLVFVVVLTALTMLVTIVPMAAMDGWIMHLAWGWFVVPTFGVAPIAWAMSTGIVLLVSWLVHQAPQWRLKSEEEKAQEKEFSTTFKRLGSAVIISLSSWFMMWCAHLWIIH